MHSGSLFPIPMGTLAIEIESYSTAMIKRLLINCPSSILTTLIPAEKQDCDIEQFGSDTYLRLMVQLSKGFE